MSTIAEKCFVENRNLFGNPPQSQPEKYNLYNGLANLTSMVESLQTHIQKLEREMLTLQQQITHLSRLH